jgi:hypothetical protein
MHLMINSACLESAIAEVRVHYFIYFQFETEVSKGIPRIGANGACGMLFSVPLSGVKIKLGLGFWLRLF